MIADLVKVAALKKAQKQNIIRSSWLNDCIVQHERDAGRPRLLLPLEPRYLETENPISNQLLIYRSHIFHVMDNSVALIEANIDDHGDSYARDSTLEELEKVAVEKS